MADETSGSVMGLVRAISRYLRINPLASDTSEGIARWWLGRETVTERAFEAALAHMQQLGIIEARQAADGRVRYCRPLEAAVDAVLDRLIRGENVEGAAHGPQKRS